LEYKAIDNDTANLCHFINQSYKTYRIFRKDHALCAKRDIQNMTHYAFYLCT